MMDDSISSYSVPHSRKPESEMIEYNRRIKQMQERLLMKEYEAKLNKKQLTRQE